MVFKTLCVLVIWTKVASALEGLKPDNHGRVNTLGLIYEVAILHFTQAQVDLKGSTISGRYFTWTLSAFKYGCKPFPY